MDELWEMKLCFFGGGQWLKNFPFKYFVVGLRGV